MEETLKDRLRKKYLMIRDHLSEKLRTRSSVKISENLSSLPFFLEAKRVGIYLHKGSEVQTTQLLKICYQKKKIVAAPKTDPKNRKIKFYILKNGLQNCDLSPYQIPEPNEKCAPIDPSQLDILIVPGIVFDSQGFRIGYGKGYFDRFLKNFSGLTIGLTYEKTLVPLLPHSLNDISVSYMITEKKIYKIN